MRIKTVVTIVLALFVVVSVAVVLGRQVSSRAQGEPAPAGIAENDEAVVPAQAVEETVEPDVAPTAEEEPARIETEEPAPVKKVAATTVDVQPAATASIETEPATPVVKRRVLAFYFHGDVRCATCRKVEAYAKEAVEEGFPERVAEGSVVFLTVNVEEAENRHYIDDFQLTSRTVVVAEEVDGVIGRWSRLDKVWQLVSGHELYLKYVRGAVSDLLDEG